MNPNMTLMVVPDHQQDIHSDEDDTPLSEEMQQNGKAVDQKHYQKHE